jgi:hypothetical protein
VRFEVHVLPLTHCVADVVRPHDDHLIEVLPEPLREEDVVSLAPAEQQNRLAFVLPIPGIFIVHPNVASLIGGEPG